MQPVPGDFRPGAHVLGLKSSRCSRERALPAGPQPAAPVRRAQRHLRGGDQDRAKEPTSVRAELSLLVPNTKRFEELYKAAEGDAIELGPFQARALGHPEP